MWSFVATLVLFLIVTISAAVMHHRQRKKMDVAFEQSERAIREAGEVAQRRHVQRFGREDTGLHNTLSAPTRPPPRASRKHQKA